MPDFGKIFEMLLYAVGALFTISMLLAVYVIWQYIFGSSDWDRCSSLDTDIAKVQCMEILTK